jgi:MSHA biogenesis protein MshJ
MTPIDKLRSRFQALTAREKIIVTATALVCVWGVWDKLFWSPVKQQKIRLQQTLSLLSQQLSDQQQVALKLESGLTVDPNQANKTRLTELNAELNRQQEKMSQLAEKFVKPQLMANALNDILGQNLQLNLIKLDTLPVSTLRDEKQQFFPIYKHGLALTFSGDYLNTLRYLKGLESLPWHINWNSIDYRVKNYPLAETTIQVYTLSFEESWLGV